MESVIDIVLAVHNGAEFIDEQIRSILEQTDPNWRLIIREEASTDRTAEIVQAFTETHPGKICFYRDTQKRGACQNFAQGLELSDGPYVMFSDCDDVWLPQKIAKTREKMRETESKFGKETPIYLFTDLTVVGQDLHVIRRSFWSYQNLNPKRGKTLGGLLIYNVTTGCTAMINAPLKRLAAPIPVEAVMHDNWLALVAAAFGKIDYISEQTLLYRQHGKNDSGARRYDWSYVWKKAMEYTRWRRILFEKNEQKQAKAFMERYGGEMDQRKRRIFEDFMRLSEGPSFANKIRILKNGFFKPGLLRNIGLIIRA